MTLHVKIKFTFTCKKHPKYNPAKEGESGIKGGCLDCVRMNELYTQACKLEKRAAEFTEDRANRKVSSILE
jgi:hypothetical protein